MEANLYFVVQPKDTSTFIERDSLDKLISLLPTKPNEIHRRGEAKKCQPGKVYDCDEIIFHTKNIECTYVDREIDFLLDLVMRNVSVLERFLPNCWCQFSIAIYSNGQVNPEITLSPATLGKLTTLSAKFWVDIYCTDEDDKEEKPSLMLTLRNLRHNLIAHPVAGLLWCLGFTKAGDWIHETF